jgi:hypothetical protein
MNYYTIKYIQILFMILIRQINYCNLVIINNTFYKHQYHRKYKEQQNFYTYTLVST